VVAAIKRAVPGAELPLKPGRSPNGTVAYLDTTRLHADTAFEPDYDLDRAIPDYVSWLTNDRSQEQFDQTCFHPTAGIRGPRPRT
jgi:UDP-glucose 4-epimerase